MTASVTAADVLAVLPAFVRQSDSAPVRDALAAALARISMDLLLQPSFTESFNVVTADGVHHGVPSVVCDAIDWAPARWQANPDDAEDLVRVAQYLLKTPQAVDDGRQALTNYVTRGVQTWSAFLSP